VRFQVLTVASVTAFWVIALYCLVGVAVLEVRTASIVCAIALLMGAVGTSETSVYVYAITQKSVIFMSDVSQKKKHIWNVSVLQRVGIHLSSRV
jgi:hypothetical protein